MCAIAGAVSTGCVDPDTVRDMCETMVHRGPDGSGLHTEPSTVLGMRRLAVVDVAGGDQPVYSEDGTVVAVFNGEIYNFAELRAGLLARGHRLTSGGDSECLVHLYEEYGDSLVHHLRGMFAFALWDGRRRRLLLARDRVGKKPLYWGIRSGSLRFASELKALVRDPEWRTEVDPIALHHYLTFQYVPAPWSIIEGIHKLPPGSTLVWEGGDVRVNRYWRLDATPRPTGPVEEEAERLRELLLEATRLRMIGERPIGAFLSGGLDSSAVVAAMARQSSKPVRTFCIGFEDAGFDERKHAGEVAGLYGTDHSELVVTASPLDVLPSLAWHFDEPFADSSAIPSLLVARMSSREVTVALNGDGGDESFGGYRRYALFQRAAHLRVPSMAAPLLERAGQSLRSRSRQGSPARRAGWGMELAGLSPADRYTRLMSYFTERQKAEIYSPWQRSRVAGVSSGAVIEQAFGESAAGCDLTRVMDVDVNTYLPGDLLVKADLSTMACSMEARSPFLDHVIMEWAAGLPGDLKIRDGTTKYLLKRALGDWLPSHLVERPKMGFGVPLASWLRTGLRPLAHDLLTDVTARDRGLFDPRAVARLLSEHAGGRDHSNRIWTLMQFELWHRTHLPVRPPTGLRSEPRPA
ncbi:asparagine synthase (glutamine-hydrolyzing) [Streptosporangium lutulentum]|uniref:asparagine synthase (glutamine-hydrolyzing) n=1 Tax=Streptosporangium lutulentum TaxID=1461250 RepID=A0ABT9Q4T5_9ACTN|nr:asparagine synthase (glutamine-hydrolyzing) [Streptosporangium lutulentum]MDP9841368.1 asparagine synthase (glutamine-hydrolyzing) [Streptosporangium lutulentum]